MCPNCGADVRVIYGLDDIREECYHCGWSSDGQPCEICGNDRCGKRQCERCGEWVECCAVTDTQVGWVCEDCSLGFEHCTDCGQLVEREMLTDGICPLCQAVQTEARSA